MECFALRAAILHEYQNYLGGGGGGGLRLKREKERDCNNITEARVQETWQEFHAYYHSFINPLTPEFFCHIASILTYIH